MTFRLAGTLAAVFAAAPAAAHEGGHRALHLHPHGTELVLILPLLIALAVGVFFVRR